MVKVAGISVGKSKDDAPIPRDSNGEEAIVIAHLPVQTEACHVAVFDGFGSVDDQQSVFGPRHLRR